MHEGLSCFGGQEEERYEGRENGHASEDRAGPLPSVNSWLMGCFSNHFFLRENLPLRGQRIRASHLADEEQIVDLR